MPICSCQISPSMPNHPSALRYRECCQPYHDTSAIAEYAEQLMRSRYSAFVLAKPDYILKTTLPAQQSLLDIKAIERWAKQTDWAGLEIINQAPKLGKRHAQVEFKAYFNTLDGLQAHHELSGFVKVDGLWYFLDPTVSMSVTQKQPCVCGSGEKFKRCCGQFIYSSFSLINSLSLN